MTLPGVSRLGIGVPRQLPRSVDAAEPAYLRCGIAASHQCLTDQQGVIAGCGQRCSVARISHTGLGDSDDTGWNLGCQAHRPLLVDRKRHEVALVDPDQVTIGGECPFELRLIVDLDEGIETDFVGERTKIAQLCVVEGGRNQQYAVGPHEPSIDHVAGIDGEVFADDRERRGSARRPQVCHRTTEPLLICQDREARCAPSFIGAGEQTWVEVGEQISLRRGASLDLADDRDSLGRSRQRGAEATSRVEIRYVLEKRIEASNVGPCRCAMRFEDAIEVGRGQGSETLSGGGGETDQFGCTAEEVADRSLKRLHGIGAAVELSLIHI